MTSSQRLSRVVNLVLACDDGELDLVAGVVSKAKRIRKIHREIEAAAKGPKQPTLPGLPSDVAAGAPVGAEGTAGRMQ